MIIITFIKHNLNTDKKELDYTQLESIEDLLPWLKSIGGEIIYILTKNKKILTPSGWKKAYTPTANLLEVFNINQKILFRIQKVVSNEGILFEDIKHCSEQLVDYIALKCVKTKKK